jgi:hypothetical protein
MRALAPILLLLAVPAAAASPEGAPPDAAPATGAEPAPDAAAAPAGGTGPGKTLAPVVPSQALVEKLGYGDRLFLAGEYRNALFAYLDAVYLEPRHAPARVKLGRAYLVLRYAAHAVVQAEAALALEPESAEASTLLEEARNAPPRPGAAPPEAPGAAEAGAAAPRPGPRVFRLTPPAAGTAAEPPLAPAAAETRQPDR